MRAVSLLVPPLLMSKMRNDGAAARAASSFDIELLQ
jgi:hypothetical protein